jgi:CDP-diacylglycerol--glycerol-3-phosphate 3-phosphatidyltransferase
VSRDPHARGRQPRIVTPANLLGLLRIGLTPVVIALLLLPFPGAGVGAAVIFAVAGATDVLDGWIARSRGEVTALGVFLDLTADKVLVAGVMIAMVEVGLLPTWIVATILVRDFVVQGMRQFAAATNVVIAARRIGKAKTFTTLFGMVLLLLAFDGRTGGPLAAAGLEPALATAGFWVMVLATGLAIVSAIDYVRGALPLLLGRS